MNKALNYCLAIISMLCVSINTKAQTAPDTLQMADPTIFLDKGVYYLYGTGSSKGFLVYSSTDLKTWKGPVGKRDGHALIKGESYGTEGFWAPQLFKHKSKYYMAYTANEHIAIAEGDSPLGPFTQKKFGSITEADKQIDPYIFKDTDGKLYLYHVRLKNGNRIYVSRMKADLSDIDSSTTKECIHSETGWENTASTPWTIAEGPTVLKHNGLYYLFYSANDYRNIDYAVGYATSKSPMGPWAKQKDSPILSRKVTGRNGTGHGDFFIDKAGNLNYVMHTHETNSKTGKRKTAIIKAKFTNDKPAKMIVDKSTFRFLLLD
ncbi:glycoside hydrolase family 43 protein [Mucilaginibacter gynuensis]|uniref:Glycoside hydrolase family 43 protein n=1 Tax=Mucilaginibacter gynuensis TaxID=1302236 RepID=A0ABP8FM16_9SPHI